MALYPTLTQSPYLTLSQDINQKVLKSNFDDLGKEQVKRKWLYPKRNVGLDYRNITNAQLRVLEQFYVDRNGGYLAFTYIMPLTETGIYEGEYVGTGDGSTTVYNLPFKSGASVSITVDGSPYVIGDATSGDCYIIEGGGQDGVDSLICHVTPASGVRVITDFTGRLAIRCRFDESIAYSRFNNNIGMNDISVSLKGILMDE